MEGDREYQILKTWKSIINVSLHHDMYHFNSVQLEKIYILK